MKITKLNRNLFTLAAAVLLTTGCASTGNDKAASTSKSLVKSAQMIEKGNLLIDQTLAKLNDLVSNPNADLRKQFDAFDASVNELGATDLGVACQAKEMKANGADYFENWDQETAHMRNENIRQRSAERKHEVAANFARISLQYDEAKTAFEPFMSDLRDVQKYLGTDLTAGGLVAVKDFAAKATRHAEPVKESLTRLSEEFKSLGISMSSASGETK